MRGSWRRLVLAALLAGCSGAARAPVVAAEPPIPPTPPSWPEGVGVRAPPDGWVDLRHALPGVLFDIRYHGDANFMGAPLPGYGAPGAWLREGPAAALGRVHMRLQARGLGLLVYDAYRPVRATLAMVAWAESTDRRWVLEQGYVARESGHNLGNTVDVSVVDLYGVPVDMGTPYDSFTAAAHTDGASGIPAANRTILGAVMAAEGFEPYPQEWWHFSWPMDNLVPRDVPYGVQEPAADF